MSNLVIIDSHIFIWGIKREDNSNQSLDVQRARTLIEILTQKKLKIVIPAPQLAELLSGCTQDKRQGLLDYVRSRYQILPFDALAAMKFGELLHSTLKDNEVREYFKQAGVVKARMKFDCMIIASAITRGIRCIYTQDMNDFNRYSKGQIAIKSLQDIPAQVPFEFPEEGDSNDDD